MLVNELSLKEIYVFGLIEFIALSVEFFKSFSFFLFEVLIKIDFVFIKVLMVLEFDISIFKVNISFFLGTFTYLTSAC